MRARRWAAGLALVAVVAGLTVAGMRLLPAGARTGPADPPGPPAATATVSRTDLATTVNVSGNLGFGTARPIKGGPGTVTWLPHVGTVVKRGQTLYHRDDRPVPLLYGSTPLFRRLDTLGLIGRDVGVLADNLKAMGYRIGRQPVPGQTVSVPVDAVSGDAGSGTARAGSTAEGDASAIKPPAPPARSSATPQPRAPATARVKVRKGDAVLTSALMAAVRRWQNAYGVRATGIVAVGDVVVHAGKLRVNSLQARPGDPADGPLMAVTRTDKVITVSLGAGEAGSIRHGDAVTVTLPDGRAAPARVTGVGTEARDGEEEGAEPEIVVTITLKNPGAADRLDAAPVKVDIPGETHKDVLAVPVGALLAVLEGGYAVQIAGGQIVPVQTGLFADGQVEVTGPGIDEGVTVTTTS